MCEAFMKIGELAFQRGHRNINEQPGLFKMKIDKNWKVEINPHKEEIDHVSPYHMAVFWNGWIAGMFSAAGGAITNGGLANEDTLIKAIEFAFPKGGLRDE